MKAPVIVILWLVVLYGLIQLVNLGVMEYAQYESIQGVIVVPPMDPTATPTPLAF